MSGKQSKTTTEEAHFTVNETIEEKPLLEIRIGVYTSRNADLLGASVNAAIGALAGYYNARAEDKKAG